MIQAENLRVVDDTMTDVAADGNTMGEIVMRGNNVIVGYYRDPAATAEAFRGGWFHSGDLGVMHADGYIELRDPSRTSRLPGLSALPMDRRGVHDVPAAMALQRARRSGAPRSWTRSMPRR